MQDRKSLIKSINRAYFAYMEHHARMMRLNGSTEAEIFEEQSSFELDRDSVIEIVNEYFGRYKGIA